MPDVSMGKFLATHTFCFSTLVALVVGQSGSCLGHSAPLLLSVSLLHLEDTWTITSGPITGVPTTWRMGIEAWMTFPGLLVTAYMLIVWQDLLLIVGTSSSASETTGLVSAIFMALSSSVLGVMGTHILPSFLSGSISS